MVLLLMNLILSGKKPSVIQVSTLESSVEILSNITEILCNMLPGIENDHIQSKRYLQR